MKRLSCWLNGHNMDPYECRYCTTCDREIPVSNFNGCGIRGRLRTWWFMKRQRIRAWWKCEDCGKRFGRHDDTIDHIPF